MHGDSEKLAKHICEQSKEGRVGGQLFDAADLGRDLDLSLDDVRMAINELEELGLVNTASERGESPVVMAEAELFFRMDPSVKGWDSDDDALAVARELMKKQGQAETSEVAKALGWDARRMNPACELLYRSDKVNTRKFMGSGPFTYGHLMPTDATRRLARDGW